MHHTYITGNANLMTEISMAIHLFTWQHYMDVKGTSIDIVIDTWIYVIYGSPAYNLSIIPSRIFSALPNLTHYSANLA